MPQRSPAIPEVEPLSTLDPTQVFLQSLVIQEVVTTADEVDTNVVRDAWERSVAAVPTSKEAARAHARHFLAQFGAAEAAIEILCGDYTPANPGLEIAEEPTTPDTNPVEKAPPKAKKSQGTKPSGEDTIEARRQLYQLEQTIDWRRRKCDESTEHLFLSSKAAEQRAATAICARCPIMYQCYEYALVTKQRDGVWGGKTRTELRKDLAQINKDKKKSSAA